MKIYKYIMALTAAQPYSFPFHTKKRIKLVYFTSYVIHFEPGNSVTLTVAILQSHIRYHNMNIYKYIIALTVAQPFLSSSTIKNCDGMLLI